MLEFINRYLLGVSVPCGLMAVGVYFLVRLKFFPITRLPAVLRGLAGNGRGSFRALALSLAGTLGVGNLVGVASAIHAGGFGAIFWMWVSAAVAAVLKYAEILLAMRHRVPSAQGFKGGAPYYIKASLSPRFPRLALLLSALFALLCTVNCLSMGAVMQTNAISEAFSVACGIPPAVSGLILAAATFFLLRGGAKGIVGLTSALVPFMSIFYLFVSLAVIIPRCDELPRLFSQIISSAFTKESAAGGIFGFLLSRSLRFGVMRGLFSNEAGCGTSPTAHISSDSSPCEQGFMGIAEVFIDTVVLCSMTGFTVMLGYGEVSHLAHNPMETVLVAYSAAFLPPFDGAVRVLMAISVLFFGFAAISCLSHYALECVGFLTSRVTVRRAFTLLYSATVFAGALSGAAGAWAVSDLTVGVMTLINLAVLLYNRRDIAASTEEYFAKKKNIGSSDKKFTKYS